jgi:hypothetical protein
VVRSRFTWTDIRLDGDVQSFDADPAWEGAGNRLTFEDPELTGAHFFGFSNTNLAGGNLGELGGIVWRAEEPLAWYADRVGPVDFETPLEASGKVTLTVGAPDSGVYFGWFHSSAREQAAGVFTEFLGVHIEGPSRIGHYFRPVYATRNGTRVDRSEGPILVPDGKPHPWTLSYDPEANDGQGTIEVTLDGKSTRVELSAEHRAEGARFDRFGLLTSRTGGSQVKIYFDDLRYTAGPK